MTILCHRRGANRGRPTSASRGGRPYSAGHFSSAVPRQQVEAPRSAGTGDHAAAGQLGLSAENDGDVVASAPSDNTDIEGRPIHRLAVQEDTLPLIPVGPSAALKIYDRCTEVVMECCFGVISLCYQTLSFLWKRITVQLTLVVFGRRW